MRSRRLGPEAFDYYFGLGPVRSYQAVADHYGVSKRTVCSMAKSDNWQKRLIDVEIMARADTDKKAGKLYQEVRVNEAKRLRDLQGVFLQVLTPDRLKALVVALFKSAIQENDNVAMRILFDRLLGRPRSERLQPNTFDTPGGLERTSDVRGAANALLTAVSEGQLAPEDAQRMVSVIETARRSIETEELEKRILEIEAKLEKSDR